VADFQLSHASKNLKIFIDIHCQFWQDGIERDQ